MTVQNLLHDLQSIPPAPNHPVFADNGFKDTRDGAANPKTSEWRSGKFCIMNIEVMWNGGAIIAETPTWSPADGSIYWIDVKKPALYRRDREGHVRSWQLESDVGAFALTDCPTIAVVALRTGVFDLNLETGQTVLLAPAPFDTDLLRFNEGICDSDGRFWIGVMFDPKPGRPAAATTAPLHCFTRSRGLVAKPDMAELHNGAAWGSDGRSLMLAHSNEGTIYRHSYDPDAGTIGPGEPFARLAAEEGLPDGAAMDEDGCYWCAIHGGGVLHRYDPGGSLIGVVDLTILRPAAMPSGRDRVDAALRAAQAPSTALVV